MKRRAAYFIAIAIPLAVVAAVVLCNYAFLQRHLSGVLNSDPRNKGIAASAHYKFYIVPSSVVFDLQKISGETSPADVTRVLLQFAQSQKDKFFSYVTLSHQGSSKFILKGDYFQTLGTEYGTQNPIYTMRTLPENVFRMDGSRAFDTWTGGWLGVVGKQMEDFAEFHKQWYIAELPRGGR